MHRPDAAPTRAKVSLAGWVSAQSQTDTVYLQSDGNGYPAPQWNGGGAKERDGLAGRGFAVYPEVLRCLVTGMKGPLADDALVSARQFARRFLA